MLKFWFHRQGMIFFFKVMITWITLSDATIRGCLVVSGDTTNNGKSYRAMVVKRPRALISQQSSHAQGRGSNPGDPIFIFE